MERTITLRLPDLEATGTLATRLARLLGRGDAVLLEGPLGAGKSELARRVLRAAAGDPALEVPSPTFTLVQSYALPIGTVHHYDLYRLAGPGDLAELGWDEAREDIVIVEWPDRLGPLAPVGALRIALAPGPTAEARLATLSGWDARLGALAA
ncbi:MAG TPA: tRNA (adenosine(37)-N6)-threonylcarbamoyltransferase complex ATPase subunit type 1 TsaE [Acetobacteraceae bacterium]|nr:tRNA (adenosine(37)-N6)-threonylcarbamoyltransferase complex ATPase subunit type 1 TsaE [Acetobacteraceae bacterium]